MLFKKFCRAVNWLSDQTRCPLFFNTSFLVVQSWNSFDACRFQQSLRQLVGRNFVRTLLIIQHPPPHKSMFRVVSIRLTDKDSSPFSICVCRVVPKTFIFLFSPRVFFVLVPGISQSFGRNIWLSISRPFLHAHFPCFIVDLSPLLFSRSPYPLNAVMKSTLSPSYSVFLRVQHNKVSGAPSSP